MPATLISEKKAALCETSGSLTSSKRLASQWYSYPRCFRSQRWFSSFLFANSGSTANAGSLTRAFATPLGKPEVALVHRMSFSSMCVVQQLAEIL
jgi:hypothetical protein